jgi:hypothetical protein
MVCFKMLWASQTTGLQFILRCYEHLRLQACSLFSDAMSISDYGSTAYFTMLWSPQTTGLQFILRFYEHLRLQAYSLFSDVISISDHRPIVYFPMLWASQTIGLQFKMLWAPQTTGLQFILPRCQPTASNVRTAELWVGRILERRCLGRMEVTNQDTRYI